MVNQVIISAINSQIAQLQARVKNLTPFLEFAREIIHAAIERNLHDGGNWDGNEANINILSGGSNKWQALKPSTKQKYKKLGYALEPTLMRSNFLRRSIGTEIRGNSIVVTSDGPYSRIHQLGGIIKHPGGTPYIIIGEGKAAFITKQKAQMLKSKGKLVYYTKPHDIKIPARPYITLREQDIQDVIDYFSLFLVS